MAEKYLTTGKLSLVVGVQEHQIRKLASQNRIPFALAGTYRVFDPTDIPAIREACIAAGYLVSKTEAAPSC